MKAFFFSLRASYIFFGVLALLFGAGSRLAGVDVYKNIFKEMTATHVIHCWQAIAANPPVLLWLLAFILTGACLLVNTGCCAVSQAGALFRMQGKRVRAVQMALIHIAALAVVILHALDMTMVNRHHPVRLYAGQTARMGSYGVTVKEITYVADPSFISEDETGRKMKSVHLPAGGFSRADNFVRLEIKKEGQALETVELKMLSPARTGATYFFLDGFFIAHGSRQIGVMVHHSTNPLVVVFFTVYSVLLVLLGWRYLSLRE